MLLATDSESRTLSAGVEGVSAAGGPVAESRAVESGGEMSLTDSFHSADGGGGGVGGTEGGISPLSSLQVTPIIVCTPSPCNTCIYKYATLCMIIAGGSRSQATGSRQGFAA